MNVPSAVARWHAIIDARADQMDRAYAALGRTSADFWDRRAATFHRATRETAVADPLFQRLRRHVGRQTNVLDVGAGTGRFTLALAPLVAQVTAVEPNARMRAYLEQEAAARGLSNVRVVPSTWEEAPDGLRADVVICSHVLYPIRDVEGFLRALDRATRRRAYLYMRAVHPDAVTSPLWQRFHGEPRRVGPTYIAAVDVLAEALGIFADVAIVPHRLSWRWATLDEALEEHLEALILSDTPAVRADLRQALDAFLAREPDGSLTLPVRHLPNAVVSWTPRSRLRAPGSLS